jgi:hypothetical protein
LDEVQRVRLKRNRKKRFRISPGKMKDVWQKFIVAIIQPHPPTWQNPNLHPIPILLSSPRLSHINYVAN